MDADTFRKAGHAAVERIAEYFETLESRPVSARIEPGSIGKLIPENPPKNGEDFMQIMKDFDRVVLPGITHWQHPNFFAYFPSNSTFESIIADMLAGAVSNPGFNWSCSPAVTEVEVMMMDWVADLLGLADDFRSKSERGGGIILGSASESCLTVVVAARERALQYLFALALASKPAPHAMAPNYSADGRPIPTSINAQPSPKFDAMPAAERAELTGRLVMYGSTQTHSLGKKAALILGLAWRSLEVLEEDEWALRGDTLRKALEEDRAMGLVPCILIATIGTTNSGAIDCLDELAEVARDYPSLWIHVDAAWAGVYLSLPELRSKLFAETINNSPPLSAHIEDQGPAEVAESPKDSTASRAAEKPLPLNGDNPLPGSIPQPAPPASPEEGLKIPPGIVHSFCTNLHKAGLVTFDCSTLFVRERTMLTDALDVTPAYLRTKHGDEGTVIDYRNWQLPLGRRFRSLKIFFVLRSFGVEGFRSHLRQLNHLAEMFEALVRDSDHFDIVTARSLSLVVFRLNPFKGRGLSQSDRSDLNELNRELNNRLQLRSEIAITGTVIGQCYCIRLAVGSQRTTEESITNAWKVIEECSKEAGAETGIGEFV